MGAKVRKFGECNKYSLLFFRFSGVFSYLCTKNDTENYTFVLVQQ